MSKFKAHEGFALVTELISLVIFGIGFIALSSLSSKSVQANSESVQRVHVSWLANSLISKMVMNPVQARDLKYTSDSLDCTNSSPTTRLAVDLSKLFCYMPNQSDQWKQTKPIEIMGDVSWNLTCEDSDGADTITCSEGSLFTLEVAWSSNEGINGEDNSVFYRFFF